MAGGSELGAPVVTPAAASNIVPASKRWQALAASLLVQFASILATTSVTVAAPSIVSSIGGFEQYAWVFSAYTLTSTIAIPLAGRLSDAAGRRAFYLAGLAIFIAGNLLAGAATSIAFLIGARALGGIGGGMLAAVSQATIGDIFPPRQRARWFAITQVIFGLGMALGPLGGGYMTALFGWRWVFLGNAVPAAIALALVPLAIPGFRRTARLAVDWAGGLSLATTLSGLIFAVTGEGWLGGAEMPARAVAALLALASLAFFVRHERTDPASILPSGLFRLPLFRVAIVTNLALSITFNATITFVPLYVIAVLAAGPETAGRTVLPFMLAHLCAGVMTGQVFGRWGAYRALIAAAGALSFTAMAILALGADRAMPGWLLAAAMLAAGFGTGIALPVMAVIIQGAVPHRILGTANAARLFFLSVGTVITVPTLTALIMLPLAVSGHLDARTNLRGSSSVALAMRGPLGEGLRLAFTTVAVITAIGSVLAFRVPRVELSETFVEEETAHRR